MYYSNTKHEIQFRTEQMSVMATKTCSFYIGTIGLRIIKEEILI